MFYILNVIILLCKICVHIYNLQEWVLFAPIPRSKYLPFVMSNSRNQGCRLLRSFPDWHDLYSATVPGMGSRWEDVNNQPFCQVGLPVRTPTQDRIKCPARVWRWTSSHSLPCGRPPRLPTPSCRGKGRTGRARLSSQMGLALSFDNWVGFKMPHVDHVTAKWFLPSCMTVGCPRSKWSESGPQSGHVASG